MNQYSPFSATLQFRSGSNAINQPTARLTTQRFAWLGCNVWAGLDFVEYSYRLSVDMAIEPLDPILVQQPTQQQPPAPSRGTDRLSQEPDRPQGVTVDPAPETMTSRDLFGRIRDDPRVLQIQRNARESSNEPESGRSDAQNLQPGTSQLVRLAQNSGEAVLPAQSSLSQVQDELNPASQSLEERLESGPSNEELNFQDVIQPSGLERNTLVNSRQTASFEFVSSDFNAQPEAGDAAQLTESQESSIPLQRPFDPSNFNNFTETTAQIERTEALVLDQPRPANDLETPVDDLNNPNREFTVQPFSPAEFAEFRVFEERGTPDPRARTEDNDFSERPTRNEEIEQNTETFRDFQEQIGAPETNRDRAADQSFLSSGSGSEATVNASAQTTERDRFIGSSTGTIANPDDISSQTVTTGNRAESTEQTQRERLIDALIGRPDNAQEQIRLINERPLGAADTPSATGRFELDANREPLGQPQPLPESGREPQPITVDDSRAVQTNPPTPREADELEQLSEEVAQEETRRRDERVRESVQEALQARDFLFVNSQTVGTNFAFFA